MRKIKETLLEYTYLFTQIRRTPLCSMNFTICTPHKIFGWRNKEAELGRALTCKGEVRNVLQHCITCQPLWCQDINRIKTAQHITNSNDLLKVFLEKLTVAHPVNKFPTFSKTWKFITRAASRPYSTWLRQYTSYVSAIPISASSSHQ